jgi:hypothetical protein
MIKTQFGHNDTFENECCCTDYEDGCIDELVITLVHREKSGCFGWAQSESEDGLLLDQPMIRAESRAEGRIFPCLFARRIGFGRGPALSCPVFDLEKFALDCLLRPIDQTSPALWGAVRG